MSGLSPISGASYFDITTRVRQAGRTRADVDVGKRPRGAQLSAIPPSAAPVTVSQVRAKLVTAADALRDAFASLNQRLRPIRSSRWAGSAGFTASVSGQLASLGAYSRLVGREVNAQGSTIRSSSDPLGLDLSSPESVARLYSNGQLGLDLTGPARASTLESNAALGLDLASISRSSTLQSAQALGLDLTSPARASTLESSTMLGLDDEQVLAMTSQFGSVTSGSFTINGTAIAVDRDTDTLQSLITRINSAGAGVTASYDADAEKLVLTNLVNSEDDVEVDNDTTGFLAAANLSTENTVRGKLRDDQQVLAKTSQFGSVTSGSFTINGTAIAVDRDTDTLQSLITRINSAGAGVTASYDADADKLVLTNVANSEDDIKVDNDSTGFLAAANLSTENTVRGNLRDDQQVLAKSSQFGSVTSGSFTINGVAIAVDPDTDTFESLIAKINAAGAGVTASYDEDADLIRFASNSNSEDDIVLADDTSGFLAAANLAGATTERGNVRDDQQVLAKTSQFSTVTNGSFTVNGTTIAVNRATDSFAAIVDRINSAGNGVTAQSSNSHYADGDGMGWVG